MKIWNRCVVKVSKIMSYAAGGLLVGLMAFIVVYILARAFGYPIFGTYEIVQLCSMTLVALALAYNEYCDGNITIDTVYVKLKGPGKRCFDIISSLLTMAICGIAAYRMFVFLFDRYASGAYTQNLQIPIWIFVIILAIAFTVLTICTLLKFVAHLIGYQLGEEDAQDSAGGI